MMRKHKDESTAQNIMKMEPGQRNRELSGWQEKGDYTVNIERIKQKNSTLKL